MCIELRRKAADRSQLRNLIEARIDDVGKVFDDEVAALRQADKDDKERALATFEAKCIFPVLDPTDLRSIRARLLDAGVEAEDLADLRIARYGFSFHVFWYNCGDNEEIGDESTCDTQRPV